MEPEFFRSLVDQLTEHPPDVLRLHSSGESTVHPQFAELGAYARKKLPKTWLQMNSGGLLWTTDEKRTAWLRIGIDLLTFSIEANRWLHDGLSVEGNPFDTSTAREDVRTEYKKYVIHPHRAGAPWGVVIPNIIRTAQILQHLRRNLPKSDPVHRVRLEAQHVVSREQEVIQVQLPGMKHPVASTWEIEFSRAFWAQHGVAVKYVPVASVGGVVDNSDMLNPEFMRAPMGECRETWTNFIIAYDGRVSPCCVDSHELELLPQIDLKKMPIQEAWMHPALESLRSQHMAGGGYPDKCKKCLGAV